MTTPITHDELLKHGFSQINPGSSFYFFIPKKIDHHFGLCTEYDKKLLVNGNIIYENGRNFIPIDDVRHYTIEQLAKTFKSKFDIELATTYILDESNKLS